MKSNKITSRAELKSREKLTLIFILAISCFLFFLVGYYIYSSHQYKINMQAVDYSDVIKSNEKLERLYSQLNSIEVNYKFRENEKNQEKYDDVRRKIDEVKHEIDRFNSYENIGAKEKIFAFFSLKNILLIIFEMINIVWIISICKGLKRELGKNRENQKTVDAIYNQREELDKYERSAEKIRAQENQNNDHNSSAYTKSNYTTDFNKASDSNDDFESRMNYTKSNNFEKSSFGVKEVSDFKIGLDKINEMVLTPQSKKNDIQEIEKYTADNQKEVLQIQQEQGEEYKRLMKEKLAQEKILSMMNNPKVKIIIDYYRNGMNSQDIAENTSLSRDEVEFVLRMWKNSMGN